MDPFIDSVWHVAPENMQLSEPRRRFRDAGLVMNMVRFGTEIEFASSKIVSQNWEHRGMPCPSQGRKIIRRSSEGKGVLEASTPRILSYSKSSNR